MEEGINLKDASTDDAVLTDLPEGSPPLKAQPADRNPESEPGEALPVENPSQAEAPDGPDGCVSPESIAGAEAPGGLEQSSPQPLEESSGEEGPAIASYTPEELLPEKPEAAPEARLIELRALVEAIIYITEEPVTVAQIASAIERAPEDVERALAEIVAAFEKPEHGVGVREVAGGYKMATKPEHHEAVRAFVRSLKPPFKLSLAALETLAVIAYKQPVTAPEIMEIRGVQGAGVLKTLLDRKLIQAAGRKNVIGKPVLYKTTKDFLVQFGLKDLLELPTLKEFEEIRRMALPEEAPPESAPGESTPAPEPVSEEPNA